MPSATKITLSGKELSLVTNSDWILTKQSIIQKVFERFEECATSIRQTILQNHRLPGELRFSIPKISKGEQYRQLPYVILDYPRLFGKEDMFAVRTMFWWAGFFSITIHVTGMYRSLLNLQYLYQQAAIGGDAYICISENQWEHHFEADNYRLMASLPQHELQRLLTDNSFVKIAFRYPLEKWNEMEGLFNDGYQKIAACLD